MKMHQILTLKNLLIITLSLSLSNCIREEFDPEKLNNSVQINPSAAAPLGFVKFELEEMLTDSTLPDLIDIDDDGFITLRYSKEVFSDSLSGFFTFPDLTSNFPVPNPFPAPLPLSTGLPRTGFSNKIDFSMNDTLSTSIDSLWINTLQLEISLQTNYDLTGSIDITSRSFVRDGAFFTDTIKFNESSRPISLDDYTIVPDNNQIAMSVGVAIDPADITIPTGVDIMSINFSFSNADYSTIFGYLGNIQLDLPAQTIPINFFNAIIDGTFFFDDALLKLNFTNSMGIPVQITMDELYTLNRYSEREDITGDSLPTPSNPWLIGSPTASMLDRSDPSKDISVDDSLILNLSNTNLFDILANAPQSLTYKVGGEINPAGTDSANFITKNGRYSADVELELPMKGYASLMVMRDTLDFDFTNFYDKPPEELKRVAFRVNIINGFPVELDGQMYFVDANYHTLDTLFTTWNLVDAGAGDGCEVEPLINEPVEIELPREKIINIADAKYIIAYARISTPGWQNQTIVTFCNKNTFEAYIGVIVDAEVNSADY